MINSKEVNFNRAVISNHRQHLKSHKYGDRELSEMAQRLNAINFSMGFEKLNTPEVLLSLAQWIKEQFGDVSMQEVASAFDLVTSKKIGNDIRHYATFSKQYIGDVLNAFKIYRAKQIKLFEEHKRQIEATENMGIGATPKEMYEGIKKIALNTGKIMKAAEWTNAFEYAWKENLIHRMNDQKRKEYKKSVIEALKSESRANIGIGTKAIAEILNSEDSIQLECHKRIMQSHFQEMIDKKEK